MKNKNGKRINLQINKQFQSQDSGVSEAKLSINIHKNYVKNKLIPSAVELLDILMIFLVEKDIQPVHVQKLVKKRQKDQLLKIYDQNQDNGKEEYSNLLYFKLMNQIRKFPTQVYRQISESISKFYFQMLRFQKLDVFKFYKNVEQKINLQIDEIIIANNLCYQVLQCLYQSKNRCQIAKNNQKLSNLYGIKDIQDSYIPSNKKPLQLYFNLLQNQEDRNEKILSDIINYEAKVRRHMHRKKFSSFKTQKDKKSQAFNFRIRRTSSIKISLGKENQQKSNSSKKPVKKLKTLKKICIKLSNKSQKLKL